MKLEKKKILEPIPFTKLLPNILTLMGLIIGVSSIRFALEEAWEKSVYCILIATIFDGVDGRVARIFNATTHFGAELDSLCDFVNFGLCPGILLYLWSFQQYEYKTISWASIMLFIICMAVRLARFNTTLLNNKNTNKNNTFFIGVPAPCGAILALVPMILEFQTISLFDITMRNYILIINLYIIVIALLLPSRIPTLSMKHFYIAPEYLAFSMIIFAAIIVIAVMHLWYVLLLLAFIYIVSIPSYAYIIHKSRKMNKL